MKKLLIITCLLPTFSFSQKYALIDRGWQKPIIFADTVTKEQLRQGWYPIYADQLDSLTNLIANFKTIADKGMHRTYLDNEDYKTANIEFEIINVQKAYGDRYDIDMTSITDVAKVKMRVINSQISNHINQYKLKTFLIYLRKYIRKNK